MNAYDIVQDIRGILGEATAEHWSDRTVLSAVNMVQKRYYMRMAQTNGEWFLKKSEALVPSSGIITLPNDCGKPVYMEEVNSGEEVQLVGSVRTRAMDRGVATGYGYAPQGFLVGNSIEINSEGYTESIYLWYDRACVDMVAGTAASGGTDNLVLEAGLGHSLRDDYYNGTMLEVVSGTGAGTRAEITDYTGASRTLIVSGSFGSNSVYGSCGVLPEEAKDAMVLRAARLCFTKPAGVVNGDFLQWLSDEVKYAEGVFFDWVETRIKNTRRIMDRRDWDE